MLNQTNRIITALKPNNYFPSDKEECSADKLVKILVVIVALIGEADLMLLSGVRVENTHD